MRRKGIQFKVGGFLLVTFALVVGALSWQSTRQTAELLERSLELSGTALKEAGRDQAYGIFLGLEAGLLQFMNQGDMEAFGTLLVDLGRLEGVQEIGLVKPDGAISFSSVETNLEQQGDAQILSRTLGSDELMTGEDASGLWVARSLVFEGDCLGCHMEANEGESAGVLFVRSGLEKFQTVERQMVAQLDGAVEKNLVSAVATGLLGLLLASWSVWWLLGRWIKRPLNDLGGMMSELIAGRLSSRLNVEGQCEEISRMGNAVNGFAESLQQEMVATLKKIGQGDLSVQINPRDGQDEIRGALRDVTDNLRELISGVQTAGQQIASGASQVASASQSLSEGAVHQASSLEEMFSSIEQISEQTRHSAENAGSANDLLSNTWELAHKGNDQMGGMVDATKEITEASLGISRIIKAIDEIAFQTNLLALNAAVEAARAGTHGKGFAVVAEEVRNLAQRSARAAGETAVLITESVEKANTGGRIAEEMAAALKEILNRLSRANELGEEIAESSQGQAQGIAEINQGAGQLDRVVQQNTATAEECAAASLELSGQAENLRSMLMKFRLGDSPVEHAALSFPVQPEGRPDSSGSHPSMSWAI